MSRQEKRANHRRLRKALRKISLAAGEGVGRAVAFSFALATNAIAAEPKKEETFTLPPVVVQDQNNPYVPPESSLSRIPVPLQDVPQSITVVPQRLMQERSAASFQDALRSVPGISFQAGEGGVQGNNLTLRGYNARNDLFLDGVRDQGSYFRDLFNIESIEVLKGPSSQYFGRGSTGGAINQVSKVPQLLPSYGGTFSLGNGLYLRGTADVNQPITPTIALRLNAMIHKDDVVGRDVAEQKRLGFAPSITFGLGTPTQLNLSYLVQGEDNIPDYGIPYVFGRPARVDRRNFYGFTDKDYEKTLLNVGTARLDHRFNDIFSLRNTLRYSHNDREHEVTAPRFNALTFPDLFNRNRPKRDIVEQILSNQTDLTAKFDTFGLNHTLVTGVEFTGEWLDRTNYAFLGVPPVSVQHPNNHQSTAGMTQRVSARSDGKAFGFGIFAADQIRLNEYFDLVGGVRWDYFDAAFDNLAISDTNVRTRTDFSRIDKMWSYRGGLIFHPTPAQSYYFSYATAFNPSAEAIQLAENNAQTAPEKNETFELGTKLQFFNGALSVQGALFRINKTNARVTDPITDLLVLEGKQRVQGFEIGIAGRILPDLNVFGGYTFLDSEFRKSPDADIEGNELLNVPRHSATLWATYDFLEKWQIGGGPTYVSSRYNNAANDSRIPGHVLWDAT
ncbi:MAG TPA: TonB-dependent siderophore receptor, partial [Candidatus Binatia bacterium]|nr:TonB-dependent siderophore receptor [Candidatus Binatia bacterium]